MAEYHAGLIAFYPTADLAATRYFYQELLGFSLIKDQGHCLIFAVPGGGCLGFCCHMPCLEHPDQLYITWVTEAVDDWYRVLKAAGQILVKPPAVNEPFQIYQTLFLDNNGYTLEIQKFLD